MISIEDCVNIEVGSLYKYVGNSYERLLMATKDENNLDKGEEKESISQRRLNSFREKALHGQCLRGTEEVRDLQS